MKLAENILKNQNSGLHKKNEQLVKVRLKELVFDYTNEVLEVLHKTGIPVSTVLPTNVILTIVIKHLAKNHELRTVISKMLLELDNYYGADGEGSGQGLTIIGGVLSTVGTLLAGIGRGQFQNSGQGTEREQFLLEQQRQQQIEDDRKRRTTFIIIGVSAFLLLGAILAFTLKSKPKVKAV